MREFEVLFQDGLRTGLRRHHRNPRNTQALVECFNLRVAESGLEPFVRYPVPFSTVPLFWPFPQLVQTGYRTWLVERNEEQSLFRFYKIEDDGSLTELALVDDSVYGVDYQRWSAADFGRHCLMGNGKAYVVLQGDTQTVFVTGATTTLPLARSVCAFRGQLILGGITSPWYDCNESYVAWSKIGQIDCTLDASSEAGYTIMPGGGIVYKVLPLGKSVLVYSDTEIAQLTPIVEPVPSFGVEQLAPIGLCSPHAVDGSLSEHVFVDLSGWVWRLRAGGNLERLGYMEFMIRLDPAKLVVTRDPLTGDYFISDGARTFLLTEQGLSEVGQHVGSLALLPGGPVATGQDSYDYEARITTDTFDFGFRSLKMLTTIEVGADGLAPLRVGVDYRGPRDKEFTRLMDEEVNEMGWATKFVQGTDFRVRVRSANAEQTFIDYLKIRWKMTDLRSVRGIINAAGLRGSTEV